jgi:hypothetical protein
LRLFTSKAAVAVLLTLGLGACAREGDIFESGILTSYTACPPVAIVAPTGDVTLFNPAGSTDASAIDVVATMTDVRGTCDQSGAQNITTGVTFTVEGLRRDNHGARDVVLPYFTSVVQGSGNVVAKKLSRVALHFEDGQYRATTTGSATAQVLKSAAMLPDDIRDQITRPRRAGDPQAALDPLADPAVRAAVDRAHFEVLVGFVLTEDQLRYNATR